ncbi:unnamed protein product [Peniophora sp. CBMAI 1063]|nr:unnamed protein product [Peniophora sp. CBMAI 1063]
MSSSEAENQGSTQPSAAKKRRIPRVGLACDRCRKRKMKCDGRLGGPKCNSCDQNGWACEYLHAMQKFQVGYVRALENRVARLQRALQELCPHEELTKKLSAPLTEENWPQEDFLSGNDASPDPLQTPSAFVSAKGSPASDTGIKAEEPADIDENDQTSKLRELTDEFQQLTLGAYHGPFSSASLVHNALNLTFELTGARLSTDDLARFGRPQFWRFNSWELENARPVMDFPPPDLLSKLVKIYFEHVNPIFPVLHQPTFMRTLSSGLHHTDWAFGFIVLFLCANAARHCDDPRVLLPGGDSRSAGWYWFNQVRGQSSFHNGTSRLYNLQCTCLSIMYLMSCSSMQSSWIWCRHGISLAQDVGAHKKKAYSTTPNAQDEQFKRAFWTLVMLDRTLSVMMARPYAMRDEEIDCPYPIACDDEYWEPTDPALAFKQPEGRPSRMDYFVSLIELTQASGPGMNVLFAGAKGRASLKTPAEGWERDTIAELDSRHTVWADSVPPHVRWNPEQENDIFFLQAAHLWVWHYDGSIILHRPFITPRPDVPAHVVAELGLPFLSICLRAARDIARIIDCVQQRFPGRLLPLLEKPVYEAGMMLFLGVWGSKKFGIASRVQEDLRGIHICMRFLETLETRDHPAGRHRDVMNALLSLVNLPTPDVAGGQKRVFDETVNPVPDRFSPLHADILASFDDWLSGTQLDTAQFAMPMPSVNGPAASNTDNLWDSIVQANDLGAFGMFDPLGDTLGTGQFPWSSSTGSHTVPQDVWNPANSERSPAYDPLGQPYDSGHSAQPTDPYAHTSGFPSF